MDEARRTCAVVPLRSKLISSPHTLLVLWRRIICELRILRPRTSVASDEPRAI